ncbi:MAG: glycine cleavage system protein GcvH [Armatimonadetes bacterium]|nr:glycine cleavage system protein GcvH [Armatimonadota bacterium]
MNIPAGCYFTRQDQWMRREGDILTLGVTEFGQNELGELFFVEFPAVGTHVQAEKPFGAVESVKSVSELLSPVAGEILAVNEAVAQNPSLVNESPYERGWLVRVKIESAELPSDVMDAAQYAAFRP